MVNGKRVLIDTYPGARERRGSDFQQQVAGL
jgi:hypothetical protein